jgi:hypothetical protein
VVRLVKASLFDIFGIGGAASAGLASDVLGLLLFSLGAGVGAAVTYAWFVFRVGRLELKLAKLQKELRTARENGEGRSC